MRLIPFVSQPEKSIGKGRVKGAFGTVLSYILHKYGTNMHIRMGKSKLIRYKDGFTLPDDGGGIDGPDFRLVSHIYSIHSVRGEIERISSELGFLKNSPRIYLLKDEKDKLVAVMARSGVFPDITGVNLLRGRRNQVICGSNVSLARTLYKMHPFRGGIVMALLNPKVFEKFEFDIPGEGVKKAAAVLYDVELIGLDDLLVELADKRAVTAYVKPELLKWMETSKPKSFKRIKGSVTVLDDMVAFGKPPQLAGAGVEPQEPEDVDESAQPEGVTPDGGVDVALDGGVDDAPKSEEEEFDPFDDLLV